MIAVSRILAQHGVPHVKVTAQWNLELSVMQRNRMLVVAVQLERLVREFSDALTTTSKTVLPRVLSEIIAALGWYQDNTELECVEHDLQYLKAVSTSFNCGTSNHHGLNYSYVHPDLSQVVCRLKHLVADTHNYIMQTG